LELEAAQQQLDTHNQLFGHGERILVTARQRLRAPLLQPQQ